MLDAKRLVIAGGSGFLGTSMATFFSKLGAQVTVLSRSPPAVSGTWNSATWDGRTLGAWSSLLAGADAIVNLAGRTVNCIKTPDHQDEILRSRVESTRILGTAMRGLTTPPPVWVQMSTAHIYGDPPTVRCHEDSIAGVGFAPTVARAWETAFQESLLPEPRGVILRTGFVLGTDRGAGGGALSMLRLLAQLGLGGRVGSGEQGMSWIHEADMNRFVAQAIVDSKFHGPYNMTAPNPVSQVEFNRTLRQVIGMPIGLPAFEWMVRIGAPRVFRTDPELALYGRYVLPARLEEAGFEFRFPDLAPALRDLA